MAPSAAWQQGGRGGLPAEIRPPAIVTEYMREGSLKGALQRKADIVQGSLMRLLIAMDAAKVTHLPSVSTCRALLGNSLPNLLRWPILLCCQQN